jgi:hypothetical protein
MTTIILTIIGILLAAAAALMVIFYGGNAFNSGSIGAAANTVQNAGTNVISAVQMYKAEHVSNPADGALAGSVLIGDYLKEAPALTGLGTDNGLASDAQGNQSYTVALTGTDAERICERVNTNLKRDAKSVGKTAKMGCDTTDQVFFANL